MNYITYAIVSIVWTSSIFCIPLFDQYPILQTKLPHITLAQLPTPVYACHALEQAIGHAPLFIKRDDLTGSHTNYGGNKVRKLEFLLADAKTKGAKKIITYGAAGTNHGLATACCTYRLGIPCLLMLRHQHNSPVVRQNLLLDHYFGAEIMVFGDNTDRNTTKEQIVQTNLDTYFIPVGGSVPLGAIGFVNAAFELQEQIKSGVLQKPDYIYLPIGSCGTTAGLLLGLALAQLDTKIIAVAVEPEYAPGAFLEKTKKLFLETNQLLHSLDDQIPLLSFPVEQLTINTYFCNTRYGVSTPDTDATITCMREQENINLEGTYSAKALTVLLADIKNQVRQPHEVILFWNTYCGLDFAHMTSSINYKDLPQELHRYFE